MDSKYENENDSVETNQQQTFNDSQIEYENEIEIIDNSSNSNNYSNDATGTADKVNQNEDDTTTQEENDESNNKLVKKPRLNKTMRKHIRYQKKLEFYRLRKEQKKEERKNKRKNDKVAAAAGEQNGDNKEEEEKSNENENDNESLSNRKKSRTNRNDREITRDRLNQVFKNDDIKSNSLKVCVDCSYCSIMSEKEQSRLAQQIGRCYSSNRATSKPAHFELASLDESSDFYKEVCRVNYGFENYVLKKDSKKIEQIYENNLNNLVYLSPDSPNVLENIDLTKTYVIGGLVDETVTKKVSLNKSNNLKLATCRLPIEEFMKRRENNDENGNSRTYNFNKILAINHVFDILLKFNETHDWKKALTHGVPKRKGFIVDDNIDNLNETSVNDVK